MNDVYSETIALFRRSLSMSGCSVLQANNLDVLPKLAEQRARHYIKGAHGYFMGSWSDGNNGGSGGANSLKKVLDKSGKGGIIKAEISIGKSLSASAKNYPVRLPDSKQRVKLAEGQDIHGKVFAGYGTSHEIRDRYKIAAKHHIPFEEAHKLQKASGKGYIINHGLKIYSELHWYQIAGDKSEEKYEMKVKRYIDESKV